MSNKTTAEKIEVMQAFERGEQIEVSSNYERWFPLKKSSQPSWNWEDHDYRIAPKPKKTIELYQWLMKPDVWGYYLSTHVEKKPAGAIKRLDHTKIVIELD